jgi:hypothetical protein
VKEVKGSQQLMKEMTGIQKGNEKRIENNKIKMQKDTKAEGTPKVKSKRIVHEQQHENDLTMRQTKPIQ